MTRSAFPWTSPTRRFTCASAIRRGSLMWYRPKTCRLLFHASAPSALPRASYRALPRASYRTRRPHPRRRGPDGRRPRRGPCASCGSLPPWRCPYGCCPHRRRGTACAPLPGPQQLVQGRAELRWGLDGAHARRLEGGVLVARRALAACDDRPGVAHALAGRCGEPGDIGHHGFGDELADELGGRLLVAAADFANQNNALGARIALEELEHIDEVHAAHRIAADADAGALAEADVGGLEDGLVGERPRARHDADRALLVNKARHDADLAFLGGDDARTVGADQARGAAREHRLHPHHVVHRDSLGDAHDQVDAGVGRFQYRIRGPGRGHVDHAGRGTGRAHRVLHGVEYRESQMLLSAPARGHAAHQLRAVGDRRLRMKGSLLAGKSLADDARIAVDQDAHALPFAASATTLRAASVRSLAAVIVSPLLASMARAACAFVPSSRTTTGTLTPTFFTALITPSAIRSQRTMPPKMFTSTARTFGFERMSSNAAVTRSAVAPPPTSRKFAGRPLCSLMRSMVAMASPAPFTMQAMSPSRDT